jgi:hypothetical protein
LTVTGTCSAGQTLTISGPITCPQSSIFSKQQHLAVIHVHSQPPSQSSWISHYKHMPLVQIPMRGLGGVSSTGGRWNYA